MSKWKTLLVIGAILIATPALAVAIDDTITPQSCNRTDPACAQFVETTSLGQIKWGGLVAGGLRSLTNLFVDGKLGVATLRPSTGEQVLRVDVEGAVGARYYCDENGNHCVRGDSLNQGGGSGTTTVLITGGNGILVNQNAINNFTIAIDPTRTQVRVLGVCAAGQAIRTVNQDGTVVCTPITGGGVNITNGPSMVVNHNATTNTYTLTVNPDVVQFRIANTCPVGQAIRGVAANGTLTCQAVTAGTGNQLWTEVPSGGAIYNTNLGNTVGIGMNNPGGATLLVSQRTTAVAGEPIATFRNVANTFGAMIGYAGGGIDAYSRGAGASALYGHVDGAGSSALVGISLGSGETYGAKISGSKVGTFAKGNIGLYATDLGHASVQSNAGRDNRIPSALAGSNAQWAGYFDGSVNINGDLNINGNVTVNGQPLAGAKQCRTCIRAYDGDSNTYSAWSCTGYNGGESEATGFSGSRSIEKVQMKMECR